MDEWYDAMAEESKRLKFHTQIVGQSLTAQQPLNNIVRTTIQALAGVLGGIQSLHTNSYDEALALPSEDAVRVALRTQQIIADESGVGDIVDLFYLSYFESSTHFGPYTIVVLDAVANSVTILGLANQLT